MALGIIGSLAISAAVIVAVADLASSPARASLTIDPAGLIRNVQGAAREQVAYMVDMAKADALEMLGESRKGG